MAELATEYLQSTKKLFKYYYTIGRKALEQLSDQELHFKYHAEDNTIAIIVKHMTGNMHSRFTNFLSQDGEKSWRNRDQEFTETDKSKAEILQDWEAGWQMVFSALDQSKKIQLDKQLVYIRNQGHTIIEAFSRQLAHYANHTGQIIYLAKSIKGEAWESLSIPKGGSRKYNDTKFRVNKSKNFFADEFIDKK